MFFRQSSARRPFYTRARAPKRPSHIVTAKRRIGKFWSRVFCFRVFLHFCSVERRRRIARVFFGLRSLAVYFLPLYSLRASSFCFWLYTVSTRAIDFRTILILASFEAAPPATFATRSCPSSALSSSSSLSNSFEVFSRSSWDLTFMIGLGGVRARCQN